MLFVHENWLAPEVDFINKLGARAGERNLKVGAVLPCCRVAVWPWCLRSSKHKRCAVHAESRAHAFVSLLPIALPITLPRI